MAGINGNVSGLAVACPVCYNSYKTNEENNIPRSLNCGHTYCTGCLEKLMSERNDTVIIRCPTCKRETVLLTLDCTHSLPKNFGLLEIIAICENDEAKVETSKNENSKSLPDDKPVCKEHDEPMKVYCRTDNRFICIYCQVYGEHTGHDCELICKLVKSKKESFANVYGQCMQELARLLEAKTHNDESFTCIRRTEIVLEEKITEHFKFLHAELTKREQCVKKRMYTKINGEAMGLLAKERMLHELIRKGNELRKRCWKVLNSSDLSILAAEERDICNVVDQLRNPSSSYDDSTPKPMYRLIWNFQEELIDRIKLHGQIVETADPTLNKSPIPDDNLTNQQSYEDVVEALDRMFGAATQDFIASATTQIGLECPDDNPVDEEVHVHEELVDGDGDGETGEIGDHDSDEGAVELVVNLVHDNSNLINELRSEMRREIQRLKKISIPEMDHNLACTIELSGMWEEQENAAKVHITAKVTVSIEYEVLSDSSSENDDMEDEPHLDAASNREQKRTLSNRFSDLRLQPLQRQNDTSGAQDEGHNREQHVQHRHGDGYHYHHFQEHNKHHQRALRMKHKSLSYQQHGDSLRDTAGTCHGFCSVPNKCHQTQSITNKQRQLLLKNPHLGQEKHCQHSTTNGRDIQANKKKSHVQKCRVCHMVNDNDNQNTCTKCNGFTSVDVTCPMCTLVNEAGKSKCELCGFDLTE